MALKISKNIGLTDIVSDANPITTEHPITGSAAEVRLFLFNDNAAKRYDTTAIQPFDSATGSGAAATWIQLAPDNAGVAGAYQPAGSALTIGSVNDTAAHPFWVKVTVPVQPDSVNFNDLKLNITAKEFAV